MNLFVLEVESPLQKFKNNGFVIQNEKSTHALVIDPAWQADVFEKCFKENGINQVDVLLTHRHKDHVDLALFFAQKYNSRIFISKAEAEFYSFQTPNLEMFEINQFVQIDSYAIETIHSPGHTKGSTCFLINGFLFTGDTLFNEGCGTCACKGGDSRELFESLENLKEIIPFKTKVYPGHTYQSAIGQTFDSLIQSNRFLKFDNVYDFCKLRDRLDRSYKTNS